MSRTYFIFLSLFLFCLTISCKNNNILNSKTRAEFSVNTNEIIGTNHEFWKAVGYDFLFKIVNEPEGKEFLDRAQKNHSVRYFRTHYTFSNRSSADKRAGGNVCGAIVSKDDKGNIHYDFSKVNKTFHEYAKRGMKPIVEFDFYPDEYSVNSTQKRNDESFEARSGSPADWDEWQKLLDRFMQNLVSEFGKDELRTWYFEVWNEPDGWSRKDLPVFFRMYDVFVHTVKSYDTDFKVGGPACYSLYFMKEFLDHAIYGTNYVTGEIGTPIDFLSLHIYGISGSWLKSAPDFLPTVSKFSDEMLWWQRLIKQYPKLNDVEIHLNEWGLCSHGDSKFVADYPQLEYRNSEYSALFMVKLVDCLYAIEDNYHFKTDLMLYWGSWFNSATGPIFWGSRDLMTSGNIPKPIMTAYEMLAVLGNQRLKVNGPKPGGRYGVLATKSDSTIQLLVYNFQETDDDFNQKDKFVINLDQLDDNGKLSIKEYLLDRKHNNTYREWERMGRPAASEEVIKHLRSKGKMEETSAYTIKIKHGHYILENELPRHSMCLYTITLNNPK